MSTLYRNYRPENFSQVLGQKHIKVTLQNEISSNQLAQAFLFCGPRAVGKTTLARLLAKAVNCTKRQAGEYEPCNKCDNCRAIKNGKHLDVIEIDAASNTGVDNVRENIISFSRLVPAQAKYKVFIIDEVHMLSPSAFNALLKIIEEPPAYVMFILCTTEIHKVPYTIVSRCERFDFKRISVPEIVGKLKMISNQEKKEIDEEVLEAIARLSGGHLRDAESLLGQVFSLGEKRITLEQAELVIPHYNNNEAIDLLTYFSKQDTEKALALINSLADAGVSMKNFNNELVFILRKMAIAKISPQLADKLNLNLGDTLEIKINKLISDLSLEQIIFYLKRILLALDDKNQLILQLPLELAVIDICQGIKEQERVMKSLNKESNTSNLKTITKKTNNNNNLIKKGNAVIKKDGINLNCAQVLEKWPEFLLKIKKYNHSLSFVLQNCQPQEINTGNLRLIFKYKFHQTRVEDENIKNIIENTLKEVFGANISLVTELNENLETENQDIKKDDNLDKKEKKEENKKTDLKKKQSDSLMNNLLNTFGGEVLS